MLLLSLTVRAAHSYIQLGAGKVHHTRKDGGTVQSSGGSIQYHQSGEMKYHA